MSRKNKPDKKAAALAKLLDNVGKAGGPIEAAKVVDDRAYRRGVKDGKRAQKAKDLPVTLIASGAAAFQAFNNGTPYDTVDLTELYNRK